MNISLSIPLDREFVDNIVQFSNFMNNTIQYYDRSPTFNATQYNPINITNIMQSMRQSFPISLDNILPFDNTSLLPPFFQNILDLSFNDESKELTKNDNVKIQLKPIKYKLHTKDMKKYLKSNKISYKSCVTKQDLIQVYTKHNPTNCSICLESIKIKSYVYNTPCCQKILHTHCLNEWVKYKINCPLCRTNLEKYKI